MDPTRHSAISGALKDLVIGYWHDVDFNWGSRAAEHYTTDGLFISPNARYEGRGQIAEFYAWRKERGERVNVHLVGNFFVRTLTEMRADVHWICTLYANDGSPPQPSAAPIAISRVEDIFVRGTHDDAWLCQRRSWHTLFRGGAGTTALTSAEMAERMARKSR